MREGGGLLATLGFVRATLCGVGVVNVDVPKPRTFATLVCLRMSLEKLSRGDADCADTDALSAIEKDKNKHARLCRATCAEPS